MQIIDRLVTLRRREHEATVALIETLLECDATRAHVDAGHRSIVALLVERLRYSPAAASRRFAAMRCARRAPFVLDMLRSHRTSLTALAKIAPLLDDADDPVALLRSIDGLTPREVDAMIATRRPIDTPPERTRAIAVAAPKPSATELGTLWGSSAPERTPPMSSAAERTSASSSVTERASASPPAAEQNDAPRSAARTKRSRTEAAPEPRVALTFSLTRDAYAAFERARTKLSRTRPRALTMEETVGALVDHYLEHEAKPRTSKPTNTTNTTNTTSTTNRTNKTNTTTRTNTTRTRHVPAATRALVLARDGHRCTFVGPDGTRCTATHDLQIDHRRPFALGGGHEPENLRVLCGTHNRRVAEMDFGVPLGDRAGP